MIKIKKNSFWHHTAVYAVGFFLLRGISFFLLPVYTNLLSPADAGFVFLIYTILAFLHPCYAYGMNSSLFKFYHNDQYDKKVVLSTSFISLVFTFSFFRISIKKKFFTNLFI